MTLVQFILPLPNIIAGYKITFPLIRAANISRDKTPLSRRGKEHKQDLHGIILQLRIPLEVPEREI